MPRGMSQEEAHGLPKLPFACLKTYSIVSFLQGLHVDLLHIA